MSEITQNNGETGLEIAVIGMSGRFPGANHMDEFWNNLKKGAECITFFTDDELKKAGVSLRLLENPNYVKANAILKDIEYFDAYFFSYTPKEAEVMDPQMRLFIECLWEALEDAAYDPETYKGLIGVYSGAGIEGSIYWQAKTMMSEDSSIDGMTRGLLNNKDFISTQVSYKLNLKGPSFTLFTACSTSLVAVHIACRSLLSGECDIAAAGSAAIRLPQEKGYMCQEGMFFSSDGHNRTFDTKADGFLFGNGIGIVILKLLENALLDGDQVYAVIKGTAINNDGNRKVGYTAPSIKGQAEVVKAAYHIAEVDPASISYIETHGTATALGDPVEINALQKVFHSAKKGSIAIGSVKTNIGHLDAAAGIASLIKTALALKHKLIPPSLNFESPNPEIDFIDSPFYINTMLTEWQDKRTPLRAGVSSFGLGGTNAHVILEEAPAKTRDKEGTRGLAPLLNAGNSREYQLILLSANTPSALQRMKENLTGYFKKNPRINLANAAYTLQIGRRIFKHRMMCVCQTVEEAIEALSSPDPDILQTSVVPGDNQKQQVIADPGKYSLKEIGRLWLEGAKINWDKFYPGKQRCRVSLPTYPFERQRYWLEGNPFEIGAATLKKPSLKKNEDIASWFYIPSWKPSLLPIDTPGKIPVHSTWLVFMDELGTGKHLVEQLEQLYQQVITVEISTGYSKENKRKFTINPRERSDYQALFSELHRQGLWPKEILHLWNVNRKDREETPMAWAQKCRELGYYSLIFLAQAIENQMLKDDIRITVVTNNMVGVYGEELLYPEKATLLGPVNIIPLEYPNLKCRLVDVVLPEPGSWKFKELTAKLLEELKANTSDTEVVYRGSHRLVPTYESIRLENLPAASLRLREQGVYLITGGLGGIGLLLAKYLVQRVKARLILTGRSHFPPRDQWEQWLTDHHDHEDDETGLKIKELLEIEDMGGEVLVARADVSNREQMDEVIHLAKKRFGHINGVIHAALQVAGGVIHSITKENTEQVFASKVTGTLVLDHILKNDQLDFFILFSSLSSILMQVGQVAYASASTFLDAFALHKTSTAGVFTMSINWDAWEDVGSALNLVKKHSKTLGLSGHQSMISGILSDQGIEAFGRIIETTIPQIAVSTRDLIEQVNNFKTGIQRRSFEKINYPKRRYQRPELTTEYLAPGNDTEQALVEIWSNFFGIEPIGIRDDFFELGGDSLKSIIITSTIHQELNTQLPISVFLEIPTIEGIAEYLTGSEIKSTLSSIKAVEKKEYYPLSSAQTRMYLSQEMRKESCVYNESKVNMLEGNLDEEKLELAFIKLIKRHESLRTSFEMINGLLVQLIHEDVEFAIERYGNHQGGTKVLAPRSDESAVGNLPLAADTIENLIRPFDLSRSPLMRVGLIEIEKKKHILIVDMHHIITDGVSLNTLIYEFGVFYETRGLPPLPLQYRDFSQWQHQEHTKESIAQQKEYWLNQFAGDIPQLNLPTDYPRSKIKSFQSDRIFFFIPGELYNLVKELAKKTGTTLFMILLAAFNILLSRYSGQHTIVVGTPITGRRHPQLQHIVGMFVNMLALKNQPLGSKTFQQFLADVKQNAAKAYENQDYQIEDLVIDLNLQGTIDRNPIYDVVLAMLGVETYQPNSQNSEKNSRTQNFTFIQQDFEKKATPFDLLMTAFESNNQVKMFLDYSTELFKRETAERMTAHYIEILNQVVDNRDIRLEEIKLSYHLAELESDELWEEEGDFGF